MGKIYLKAAGGNRVGVEYTNGVAARRQNISARWYDRLEVQVPGFQRHRHLFPVLNPVHTSPTLKG
jgi:hypothetical protein